MQPNRFNRAAKRPGKFAEFCAVFAAFCALAPAQTPPKLTLQQAEAMAMQNHPQIQAAQHEVGFAQQQIVISRSPLYPTLNGELTGSGANSLARLGAGDLSASRLFDREGQGLVLNQLISDFGRTSNLVSSARYRAQATEQDLNTTRYGVALAVDQAYYNVLQAQALVKVAQQTVDARQTVADQVTELAKNKLKSNLDVSFADYQVSQAKLMLISAQEAVTEAFAELGRTLGSDQPASYTLVDEPLPPGPPAKADDLVTQAINNRPELASLKASRESAYKFYEAEKDLSRPTVSAIATAGYLPYINTPAIPAGYAGAGANMSIPILNGHLFSARREAAHERALEADQHLRDEQERVSRDVRKAYSGAITAYQRIDVTAELLREAAMAQDLAKGRYDLGLASIVELTQAQLQLTEAEIANTGAKYDYQAQYAMLQYVIGALR